MGFATTELIDEPAIDGSDSQLADKRACVTVRNLAQNPLDFTRRKIGIEEKPRALLDECLLALPAQFIHELPRSPVLPHNGRMHWFASRSVPDHNSLALICDACSNDILLLDSCLCHGFPGGRNNGVPNLRGIMLHPTGLGKILGELTLGGRDRLQELVVDD